MRWSLALLFVLIGPAPWLRANSVTLGAAQDNTMFSESENSNGGGGGLFSGRNNSGNLRRSLLQFDIGAAVPFGARIDSVTLTLRLDAAALTETLDRVVEVHALSASWGEADSNSGSGGMSGMGAPAQPGDATWQHRFFPDELWSTPGGDYRSTASASALVGIELDYYSWSSAGLIDDVQSWLDGTAENDGWLLIGDEVALGAARRFCSREFETPEFRPALTVSFTPRLPGDANADFHVSGADFTIWADHFGQSGVTVNEGDFNGDTLVTGADFTIWADHFGESAALPAPEPSSLGMLVTALSLGVGLRKRWVRASRLFGGPA